MQEFIALKDIEANPYRGLEHYPIQPQKIAHLKESFQTTGFWPGMIGRRRNGKIQIPFAHHRWKAGLELYGPSHKIPIDVREISDAEMFQMMARENMEEWETTPIQDFITVRELLAAISRSEITLPPAGRGHISNIPRVANFNTSSEAIARFLGWTIPSGRADRRLVWIMDALDLMDAKLLKLSDLEDLNQRQVSELIFEVNRRKQRAEREAKEAEERAKEAEQEERVAASAAEKKQARERQEYEQKQANAYREHAKTATRTILKEIGSGLREGKIATKEVRAKAFEAVPPAFPKQKKVPEIDKFAEELACIFRNLLKRSDLVQKLLSVSDYQQHLSPMARESLVWALEQLVKNLEHWIERFDPNKNGQKPPVSAGPRQLK